MADPTQKLPDNVPGAYYVDNSCTDCGLCPSVAPSVFKRNDLNGYSYVFHQPATPSEQEGAEEARQSCPTDSIGFDAEKHVP